MATLPNQARQPIPLDSLLARHARPVRGPVAHPAHRPAPPTLAELERRSSVAPSPSATETAAPPDIARAIVLCITRATCACGRVYTYPNRSILVRFDKAGLSNAVHYARETLSQYASLPRERKILDIEIPFCDECF